MIEPRRLVNDPNLNAKVRDLLSVGDPIPAMPTDVRLQLEQAVSNLGPVSKRRVLSLKFSLVGSTLLLMGTAAAATLAFQVLRQSAQPSQTEQKVQQHAPMLPATTELEAPKPAPPSTQQATTSRPKHTPPRVEIDSSLAAEAQLLERARHNIKGAPSEALRLVAEHQKRFANPQLVAERELLGIRALFELGQRQRARQRAEALLLSHPNGIYAEIVRELLAADQAKPQQ